MAGTGSSRQTMSDTSPARTTASTRREWSARGTRSPIATTTSAEADTDLPVTLGTTAEGNESFIYLSEMPHLLVAGTTGSGKSVFLNSLICDVLDRSDAWLMLVDPKRVEFAPYRRIVDSLY